jgi:hypothetical protein
MNQRRWDGVDGDLDDASNERMEEMSSRGKQFGMIDVSGSELTQRRLSMGYDGIQWGGEEEEMVVDSVEVEVEVGG